ncbi:MAG TPA: 4Fe-4S double cluster binding domain-containing protein, partial [Clostridia bacterium]|nr:4Fe-4S double cluster binding domain-containing protein [Clostridia bacterium]
TKFGSWVAIDTWIVDKDMEHDGLPEKTSVCPPDCGKCIAACPTKALSGPHMMDMGKCVAQLSYFSTELYSTGLIPEELREKMGTWLYGCDICQDVCPMNKNRWEEADSFPGLDELDEFIKLENIVKMDEKTFLDIIQPRFWYIEKDGLWIWKCNALQAMVNSGDAKYHKYIKEACTDGNENVREMAAWACKKLAL